MIVLVAVGLVYCVYFGQQIHLHVCLFNKHYERCFYSLAKESKKETNWKLNIEDFQKYKQPEEKVKTFSKALR